MLACNHDLCLTCAATIYNSIENKQAKASNSLKCLVCGVATQLD